MTEQRIAQSPPRLAQTSDGLAELFSESESAYRQGLDEVQAWDRLQARFDSAGKVRRARRGFVSARRIVVATAVAACLLMSWFGLKHVRIRHSNLASQASRAGQPAHSVAKAEYTLLASGESRLLDGTVVGFSNGAHGTLVRDTRGSTLKFDRGRLDISVAHQPQGRQFAVETQGVEFVVVGTRFSVTSVEARVDLSVLEGRVAVNYLSGPQVLVAAGGHWSSLDNPKAPGEEGPSAARAVKSATSAKADAVPAGVPAPSDLSDCRDQLNDGNAGLAERCYLKIAAGSGLSAEMALYEVARIRRDVLLNPNASLAALDEYQSRFGSGTLAPEVRMARVDLLSRLGRIDDALRESAAILASPSGHSLTLELRLLRGNLLRDKKNDCAAAAAEYQQIESDPGPRGDQAQLARAGCLERVGRKSEAIQTYRSYLERSKPIHAERAQQRLAELQP
jgi:ferric-dicitrate binding protein FerR (iron transport regulator)